MAPGYCVGQLSSRRVRDDSAVVSAPFPGPGEDLPVTKPKSILLLDVWQRQSLRRESAARKGLLLEAAEGGDGDVGGGDTPQMKSKWGRSG